MLDINLTLWEFDKGPAHLRNLFPGKFTSDWLVLVRPDQAPDFVSDLIVYWTAAGLLMAQSQAADGGIVLAGVYTNPPTPSE